MSWKFLPERVPGLLPPLDNAPPVDQVEDEEEQGEKAEEDHVRPAACNSLSISFYSAESMSMSIKSRWLMLVSAD